ncbi:unnamed protein product, partial [Phaeothamnion confervicola]
MAKASIELPNGTSITIEGTPEEVRKLLEYYGADSTARVENSKGKKRTKKLAIAAKEPKANEHLDLADIVNLIRNSDEAEKIETAILDRTSQVNRILLPLYIVHEEMGNAFGLTSGDISRITTNLGIPVQTPN